MPHFFKLLALLERNRSVLGKIMFIQITDLNFFKIKSTYALDRTEETIRR